MPGPTSSRWKLKKLKKNSSVPAYVQIAENLTALLKSGPLLPGSPLPTERELCEHFRVSRMTLRQALGVLDRDGLIESHRGRGTFVARNRLRKQQQELRSFTEEILARGGTPESRLLSMKVLVPEPDVRQFFDLEEADRVFAIRRLRLSDKAPIAVETVQIPQRFCPGLDAFDLATNSLYVVLEEKYGLYLETCVEEISAELAKPADRKLLELTGSAAVLVVHRRTHTDSGQPIEFTKATYRGDSYSAIVHSVRRKRAGDS